MAIAIEDRDAAGELLPAPARDIDLQRIELHREAAAAGDMRCDNRARAVEWLVDGVADAGIIHDRPT